jgi:glutamyl-Q tRNA(Asp) synthetase
MTSCEQLTASVADLPPYVGRFAPSPTGPLHFGSLVAALASYVDARQHGGQWIVRMEDVDEGRTVPGAADDILRTLEAYGFAWDGPVVTQSARKVHYEKALAQLQSTGSLFVCRCTRKSLEGAPLTSNLERLYPGTCRTAQHPPGAHTAWRARVPDDTVSWLDQHFGAQHQSLPSEVGDFVVKRADGLFAYQLAVVVDDALQGVNHVVRGVDLLSSTARQIWLQRALGYPTPHYLHVPVVVNGAGEKLSKQTKAAPLTRNHVVDTLVSAWTTLGQTTPTTEWPSGAAFLKWACSAWDVTRLPRSATVPYPRSRPAT